MTVPTMEAAMSDTPMADVRDAIDKAIGEGLCITDVSDVCGCVANAFRLHLCRDLSTEEGEAIAYVVFEYLEDMVIKMMVDRRDIV